MSGVWPNSSTEKPCITRSCYLPTPPRVKLSQASQTELKSLLQQSQQGQFLLQFFSRVAVALIPLTSAWNILNLENLVPPLQYL
ncbi:unnamed protein product, partial [Timema podura]|nr:unnamed protein product [Timema podura]